MADWYLIPCFLQQSTTIAVVNPNVLLLMLQASFYSKGILPRLLLQHVEELPNRMLVGLLVSRGVLVYYFMFQRE